MTTISPLAFMSGMFAAGIFMIFGWPLANLLSLARGLFTSFQMKLLLVAVLGAASAPIAERHAPALQNVVSFLDHQRHLLPVYMDRLQDRLP